MFGMSSQVSAFGSALRVLGREQHFPGQSVRKTRHLLLVGEVGVRRSRYVDVRHPLVDDRHHRQQVLLLVIFIDHICQMSDKPRAFSWVTP